MDDKLSLIYRYSFTTVTSLFPTFLLSSRPHIHMSTTKKFSQFKLILFAVILCIETSFINLIISFHSFTESWETPRCNKVVPLFTSWSEFDSLVACRLYVLVICLIGQPATEHLASSSAELKYGKHTLYHASFCGTGTDVFQFSISPLLNIVSKFFFYESRICNWDLKFCSVPIFTRSFLKTSIMTLFVRPYVKYGLYWKDANRNETRPVMTIAAVLSP